MPLNAGLSEFVRVASGGREAALILAQSESEIAEITRFLEGEGFKRADNLKDFFVLPKLFYFTGDKLDKDIYDFVVQYPSGHVEIFDKEKMVSQTLSPDYGNKTIIIIMTKENFQKARSQGLDLIPAIGPSYQTDAD